MVDIESKIAQYLKTHSEMSLQDVSSKLEELNCDFDHDRMRSSIFQIGDGISEEQLVQYVSETTGKDSESVRDAAGLLFDILDTDDASSGLLTTDELDFISDDGRTIDGFELWNKTMTDIDLNEIENILNGNEEAESEDAFGASTEDTAEETNETDIINESSEAEATEEVEETEESNIDEESGDLSEADIEYEQISSANLDMNDPQSVRNFLNSFIDSENIKTYDDAIVFVAETLGWGQDDIDKIKQTLMTDGFTEQNMEQINNLMSQGLSYDEAVKALGDKGLLELDASVLNEEITDEKKSDYGNSNTNALTDKKIAVFAEQLYSSLEGLGTDKNQFTSILDNESISSDDFVKIIDYYNDNYGSFIKAVEKDFSFVSNQTEIMKKFADKLLDSASNGNEQAIKVLCQEMYNGTAGMAGTADAFIARIMDIANERVLGKIVNQYSDYNNGASIYKNIQDDFSLKTEDSYINKLNNAYSKYSEETQEE